MLCKIYCHKPKSNLQASEATPAVRETLLLRREQQLQLVMKREVRKEQQAKQQQELPAWACKLPPRAMLPWVVLNTM